MEEMDIDMTPYLGRPLDINNICRACLKIRGVMMPLYAGCLEEMLTSIVGIEFKKGDGFPSLLCLQCITQISKSHTFKQQCLKSAWTVKKFLSPEFQEKLADFQKPICEATSSNNHFESLLKEKLLKYEFDQIGMSGELILDSSGDEVKTVTLEQLTQTSLDDINFTEDIIPLKNYTHVDAGTPISSENETTPTRIFQIGPDGTAHIMSNKVDNNTSNDESQELVDSSFQSSEEMEEFKCLICGVVFDTRMELKIHLTSHENDHYCTTCGKNFKNARTLKRHLKTHSTVKPHVCDVCNKSFAESSNLSKHKKKHTGELRNIEGKPHLCSACGRSFKWATSLYKHFKYHTGKKLLSCSKCPKQYAEARSLNIHLRSHTGEKPYVCNVCNKRFTQDCNLAKHIRVHMGQKPFVCTVCGKGFSQKASVKIHMRTHTGERPYTCNTCGKSFTGANALHIHQRIHTEEKPFECKFCSKLFARQETLRVHLKSHYRLKPHNCTFCDRTFVSSETFSNHMKIHEGDKRFTTKISHDLYFRSRLEEISSRKEDNSNCPNIIQVDKPTDSEDKNELLAQSCLTQ